MGDCAERLDDGLTVRHGRNDIPPACILTLTGTAEAWNAEALAGHFERTAAEGTALVVDLSGLLFGGWDLVGLLLHARTQRPVVLVGPLGAHLAGRLALTGAGALFAVAPSIAEALAVPAAP
ncbi:anti-sigma factor antagonist [Streptomyces sp. NPDC091272]|uniref:anti-sigma factor antagonist n=1 Tax=Streptomyces sp. NPDC091272 TaxID=3365981 RepID=UPI0037F27730